MVKNNGYKIALKGQLTAIRKNVNLGNTPLFLEVMQLLRENTAVFVQIFPDCNNLAEKFLYRREPAFFFGAAGGNLCRIFAKVPSEGRFWGCQ